MLNKTMLYTCRSIRDDYLTSANMVTELLDVDTVTKYSEACNRSSNSN